MIIIDKTDIFASWFKSLKDRKAKEKILTRFDRLEQGNFGDHKQLADRLWELRIPHGPGYRIYYTKQGRQIVLLLAGGTKKRQARDVQTAKELLKELED